MKDLIITSDLVDSIHKSLDKGLVKGLGKQIEGEMCVEALICFKLGLPRSDNPPCVGEEVRKAKIALNDCDWPSNQARAEGMRKLAIAQLGSNKINQKDFLSLLKLKSVQRILPLLVQQHYNSLEKKDEKLLEYKAKFENLKELDDSLWKEFYYDSYYHYHYYHTYHSYYTCSTYHSYYTYYSYYSKHEKLKLLTLIADVILQTLIELKSPGCEWL